MTKNTNQNLRSLCVKNTIEKAVLPLTLLKDGFGMVQGLDTGDLQWDEHPNADEWKKMDQV